MKAKRGAAAKLAAALLLVLALPYAPGAVALLCLAAALAASARRLLRLALPGVFGRGMPARRFMDAMENLVWLPIIVLCILFVMIPIGTNLQRVEGYEGVGRLIEVIGGTAVNATIGWITGWGYRTSFSPPAGQEGEAVAKAMEPIKGAARAGVGFLAQVCFFGAIAIAVYHFMRGWLEVNLPGAFRKGAKAVARRQQGKQRCASGRR